MAVGVTETAAKLVTEWGNDFREVRKLSDPAIGELIRRIAIALIEQTNK